MKFWDLEDGFATAKRLGVIPPGVPVDKFFRLMREMAEIRRDPFAYRQALLEEPWLANGKPYYNVWPVIVPMFEKLNLDIPSSVIKMPTESLLLRLPVENNPLKEDGGEIRTLLFGVQEVAKEKGSKELVPGLVIQMNTDEMAPDKRHAIHTFRIFPLREDMTVEKCLLELPYHESWKFGKQFSTELILRAVKLCVCVCLIGEDPELVTADVLAKDRPAWERGTPEQRKVIEERAWRRGKRGFDLGKRLEIIPHYRRPHPALIRVGKGRAQVKLILRSGSVVHRQKISEIPTGYAAKDLTNDEK